LTGKLWVDDSQVVAISAIKVYATDQPKVVYRITEVLGARPQDDPALALPF
jgi:Holliday junction resolvase RusA-like endonuclease